MKQVQTVAKKGFTLVEVVIFIMLISMIFVTISYSMASTIRDTKVNEHKILGSHYADELKEWISSQRETDWPTFYAKGSPGGTTYCFPNATLDWTQVAPCNQYLNGIYMRQAVLTTPVGSPNQVNVDITVSFSDTGRNFTIPIHTIFSLWE
jgi:type II secretory pathway pseudopilin PulG